MCIRDSSNTELQEVLDELYLDDAVDIVEEMPASVVIRILDRATPEMRKSINEILKYPEDSAGSIMNMEFLSLKKDMTVEDAFKRIRRIGGDMETINILYVTDPTRHLLGVLSVRDLLLAEEDVYKRQAHGCAASAAVWCGCRDGGTDAVLRHRCAQPAAHDRRHLPVPQPDLSLIHI